MVELRTARLLLRRWRPSDRAPFAALNADPRVMAHFPAPLTRQQSDALVDRAEAHHDEHGYGLWALELHAEPGSFLGFTGLQWLSWQAPSTSALEVGWRLSPDTWGHGYATEAAVAAIAHGLTRVDRVVSVTACRNAASERVMQRAGMRRDGEFEHPLVPTGHPLRPHVRYRADRGTWSPPRE